MRLVYLQEFNNKDVVIQCWDDFPDETHKEYPNIEILPQIEIKEIIKKSARKEQSLTKINNTSGRLDALAALNMAENYSSFNNNFKIAQK